MLFRSDTGAALPVEAAATCQAWGHPQWEEAAPWTGVARSALAGARQPQQHPADLTRPSVDRTWRRESYSGLLGSRKGRLAVAQMPDEVLERDDGEEDELLLHDGADPGPVRAVDQSEAEIPEPVDTSAPDATEVPLRRLAGGTRAGTWEIGRAHV